MTFFFKDLSPKPVTIQHGSQLHKVSLIDKISKSFQTYDSSKSGEDRVGIRKTHPKKPNKTHLKKHTECFFLGFFKKSCFFSQISDENEYSLETNQVKVI